MSFTTLGVGLLITLLSSSISNAGHPLKYIYDGGSISISLSKKKVFEDEFSKYIIDGENASISNITKIYFESYNEGYFIEFEKDGKPLESILVKKTESEFEVYAIYESGIVPFDDEERYCLSPFEFSTSLPEYEPILTTSAVIDYSYSGISFSDNVTPTSSYLKINDVSSHQYIYSSSYLSEVKLLNVPNYMNTQYCHKGCTPTTAAMYFAYLEDNGYGILTDYRYLPIKHTDDVDKVNNYIRYLGDSYFDTSCSDGTYRTKIPSAYNLYFSTHGYPSIYTNVSKNYNEYTNSIYNCALPVPMSIFTDNIGHSVLGIGYRQVSSNTGMSYFLTANYVYNDVMSEVTFSSDILRQFYFLHK